MTDIVTATPTTRLALVADAARWVSGVAAATAVVLLFSLRGAEEPTPAAIASGAEAGAGIYARHCASCHGNEGQGGTGPVLAGVMTIVYPDPAQQAAVVAAGRGAMPPFGDRLDATEIDAVVAFTREVLG